MTTQATAGARAYIDPRIGAFAIFAMGVAAAVFLALLSRTPDYARAAYSVWPSLVLGGLAVAFALNGFPAYRTTAWRALWAFGFVAYLIHLWFAMGGVFDWRIDVVFERQGALVAAANLALAVLWALSVAAAYMGLPASWLHIATMALFVVATVASTIVFARGTGSLVGGGLLVIAWVAALALRPAKPAT